MTGTPTLRLALAALLLFAGTGCFGATSQQLRSRATHDLRCDDIVEEEIDARTRVVRGCGQQAIYIEHCRPCANGYVGCECTWVLNSHAANLTGHVGVQALTPSSPGNPT